MLADALRSYLTPEQLSKLIDEVLAVTKRANVESVCKHCHKKQMMWIQVPDAKAVALALPDLLNQAFGRVGEANLQADPVAFKRLTITDDDEAVHDALQTVVDNRKWHQQAKPLPTGNGTGELNEAGPGTAGAGSDHGSGGDPGGRLLALDGSDSEGLRDDQRRPDTEDDGEGSPAGL
jgi:hypothetical protein